LFPTIQKNQTLFDIIVENQDTQLIESFLKIMISQDKSGFLYNEILERNLNKMIEYGIDLINYFQSQIYFH
jgi:hypothetical protein